MTGVQNGPELQLQVRLNVFRADTISPLPMSHLVQLDPPPRKLILTAKDPPRATLGLGRAGWPQQHQLAPSACSTELLAGGTRCFSMSCTGGTQQLCTPLEQPSHSRRRHSTASPLMWGRGAHFSPSVHAPVLVWAVETWWKDPPNTNWDGQQPSTGKELAVGL